MKTNEIVAQLIAITNKQIYLHYSRDYTTLLMKQNEDLTNYNSKLKHENNKLGDHLNKMAYALPDLK